MKRYIIIGMAVLCSLSTTAQPLPSHEGEGLGVGSVITLDQCRQMALANNAKIKNAQIDIESAEQQRKEAFTNYFPSVSASGMGMNSNKGLMQMSMGPGMDVAMMKNGVMGMVSATQPVFAGGQIVNGNKLAKVGLEASRLQMQTSENEVVLNAEQYYWNIVSLQANLQTIDAMQLMYTALRDDVQNRVDAGMVNRNNLLQVQIRLNENRSTRANLVNSLKLCKMVLAQYCGLPTDQDFEVASNIVVGGDLQSPTTLKADHQQALGTTPEYQLLQKNVEQARLNHKMEIGSKLPSVAVGAGYMYMNLMDKDQTNALVFATVSVPISDWWGGSHAIKRKRLVVQTAENNLRDNAELLLINMQSKWNDVENAYEQLKIDRETIDQSEENLRLQRDQYDAGQSTMSDLLTAALSLQNAQSSYISDYTDYQLKLLEYRQAIGQTSK